MKLQVSGIWQVPFVDDCHRNSFYALVEEDLFNPISQVAWLLPFLGQS